MTGPGQLLPPRPYQTEAIDAAFEAWGRGVTRPATVLATGLGKTVIFGHTIARDARESDNAHRALVLVHRDELIRQAVDKLRSIAPHLPVGVVKAGEDQTDAQVIVASVQTLARRSRRERISNVGLVVVDECHHATATSYLDVLEHFGSFGDVATRTLGVTATMTRTDGIALGQVWQEIVYERDILWGIRHGYLVDVEGVRVQVDDMDLKAVRSSAGDYRMGDLGSAFEDSSAAQVIAKSYAEHGAGRQGVAFTPTVATAHSLAEVLTESGIEARAVDGAMGPVDRAKVMRDYESGAFQVLTNCMVATEGWDSPATEVAVIARNTQSAGLYVQMVGRVLRPNPARPEKKALVMDVVGVSARHGLVGINSLGGFDLVDDETLLEAAERVERELDEVEELAGRPERRVERIRAEAVDLFHGSRFVWNHTQGGIPFVSAGDVYVIVIPEPDERGGGYAVAALPKKKGLGASTWVERDIPDLSYALVWGEEAAGRLGSDVLTQRERAWRKKRATEKARALASKLKIIYPEDVKGGDLADLIDGVFATKRIDAALRPYLRQMGVEL